MKRLRRPDLIALAVVAAAIAASPAAALAAGEESSEGTSTGWVPQGSGNESSGNETTSVRHGSSLGSGASPSQTQQPSSETSYTPPASSSYEAPASTPVSEPASAPVTETGTGVVKQPVVAPVVKYPPVAVGTAVRVSAPEPTPVAETKPANPAPTEPVAAASHDQASTGSGPNPLTSLALLGLIIGGIVLAYVVHRELRAGQAMPRRSYLRN